jgi:large conductance mechanosensitive channel
MSLVKEFRDFATKGNVLDLAVGIIIGGAFGKIVSSLVADVLMPPIGYLVGGMDFKELKFTLNPAALDPTGALKHAAVTINYGMFLQQLVDFAIIAFAIFMVVKGANYLQRKKAEAPAPPAEPTADVKLLIEIRDLLKNQK